MNNYLFAGTSTYGVWKRLLSELVASTNNLEAIPSNFKLEQNYPNPFNPTTIISYVIPSETRNLKDFSSTSSPRNDNVKVTLKVYDILGKVITTLVNEHKPAGMYNVTFNALHPGRSGEIT
jgi:hypothetical protein